MYQEGLNGDGRGVGMRKMKSEMEGRGWNGNGRGDRGWENVNENSRGEI